MGTFFTAKVNFGNQKAEYDFFFYFYTQYNHKASVKMPRKKQECDFLLHSLDIRCPTNEKRQPLLFSQQPSIQAVLSSVAGGDAVSSFLVKHHRTCSPNHNSLV